MAHVYFLHSEKDEKWYIGCTDRSPYDRFCDHCNGYVLSTKHRRPLSLAYIESFDTLSYARKREWHLKHKNGYKEKRAIIKFLLENPDYWPCNENAILLKSHSYNLGQ